MGLFDETSINFGNINSYTDLGLIAKETPFVALPEPRLDLREVTGMSGKLDYTNVLDSKVRYKNRTGSWTFRTIRDYMSTWLKVYQTLHGKEFDIRLASEKNYQYHGRVSVGEVSSKGYYTDITISYDLEPRRKLALNNETIEEYGLRPYKDAGQLGTDTSTKNFDWLWNDLFSNTIYYGTFEVKGQKWRNILNTGDTYVTPTFTVSDPMRVNFNGKTINLIKGKNIDRTIQLDPGDNLMEFVGNGTVNVDYTIGDEV